MATVALDALPPPVATRVLQLLPVADRVRAGGVSPVWRALAHAPALYGPELVLAHALVWPRTVADAKVAQPREYRELEANKLKSELRCSSVSILRSLAALAAGTLTRLDVRGSAKHPGDQTPDKILSEALVEIAARNPNLTEIFADAPSKLPACLQLLARCPRVQVLTMTSLAVAPAELLVLTGAAAALAARLTLTSLDLGRDTQEIMSAMEPSIIFFGAITTHDVAGYQPERSRTQSLRRALATVATGAWQVSELHLPGCKSDDSVLVWLLEALTKAAAADPWACGVEHLVLHYSWKERQKQMSAAAGTALAAAAAAMPVLLSITFSDEQDPSYEGMNDIGAGRVDRYLLEEYVRESSARVLTPGGHALFQGLADKLPHGEEVELKYGGTARSFDGSCLPRLVAGK
jgi:hypothetical protein